MSGYPIAGRSTTITIDSSNLVNGIYEVDFSEDVLNRVNIADLDRMGIELLDDDTSTGLEDPMRRFDVRSGSDIGMGNDYIFSVGFAPDDPLTDYGQERTVSTADFGDKPNKFAEVTYKLLLSNKR